MSLNKPKSDGPTTTLQVFKAAFREYLKECEVVSNEQELDALMALLHEPLPLSFRVNLHRQSAATKAIERLANDFQFAPDRFIFESSDKQKQVPVTAPEPLVWYPMPNVAWQMDCGKVALAKSARNHQPLRQLHQFVLQNTEMGVLDRQEAVSMLPVVFLQVLSHHKVIDMCASPGSKTTQVIDFLLANKSNANEGLVVANDCNKKRAYMLVHRLTRNTLRKAVVTCCNAQNFPGLYDGQTLRTRNVFDRVLCDVPCSGDGTLRKNQALWKDWHIGQGISLFGTQVAIALRGAELLKPKGGRMVYSTCSMNPVEDEAVVAEVLRRAKGALKVVDAREMLPALQVRKGRTKWKVGWRSKSKSTAKGHVFRHQVGEETDAKETHPKALHQWFSSFDQVPLELQGSRIQRAMFAPSCMTDESECDIAKQLENTLRLVPIDQNSGGFFVAVLEKVGDLPVHASEETTEQQAPKPPPNDYVCKICQQTGHYMKYCAQYVPDEQYTASNHDKQCQYDDSVRAHDADDGDQPTAKKAKVSSTKKAKAEDRRETPYRQVPDHVWQQIAQFYGIHDTSGLRDQLFCRSETAANLNFVEKSMASACLGADGSQTDALDIVNMGLKVFSRVVEDKQVFYRVVQEALGFIDQFFTKRRIKVSLEDFHRVLQSPNAHVAKSNLSQGVQQQLDSMELGPAVVYLQSGAAPTQQQQECEQDSMVLALNVWVGKNHALLPRVSPSTRLEMEQALEAQGRLSSTCA